MGEFWTANISRVFALGETNVRRRLGLLPKRGNTLSRWHASMNWKQKLQRELFREVDCASLVFFRIAFGLVMFWEVTRFFQYDWINEYFIKPSFHFQYYGFGWVEPLPGPLMYGVFIAIAVLALCIAAGLYYRVSMTLFCVLFTYQFLIEQARYLNHFYLICLLNMLMIRMPLNRCFSLDAWRKPEIKSQTIPQWCLWLLWFQFSVVYFYGGLAKINADWFAGEPMRMWMASRTAFPIIGHWFTEEWMVYIFTWGGLLLDLFIAPALIYRRTRPFALLVCAGFHLSNAWLFPIGIFPWFMLCANMIFCEPDWPRRAWNWVRRRSNDVKDAVKENGGVPREPSIHPVTKGQRFALVLAGIYIAVQLIVPFRHFLYPGDASWSEEGHKFAWRMKLREKRGSIQFAIVDNDNDRVWHHNAAEFLTPMQMRKMSFDPDMIHQYAIYLADSMRAQGVNNVSVRVKAMSRLNGRNPQPLIDSSMDIASMPRTLAADAFIPPLTEPLKRPTSSDASKVSQAGN